MIYELDVTYRIEADTLEDAQAIYEANGPELTTWAPIWTHIEGDIVLADGKETAR